MGKRHHNSGSRRKMQALFDEVEQQSKQKKKQARAAAKQNRQERKSASDHPTNTDATDQMPYRSPFNRNAQQLIRELACSPYGKAKDSANGNTEKLLAYVIISGPIWAQLVLALRYPFGSKDHEAETVVFQVEPRIYFAQNGTIRKRHRTRESFPLVLTITGQEVRQCDSERILHGKVANLTQHPTFINGSGVDIFYRLDSRYGAILTHKVHSTDHDTIDQNYFVPPSLNYN